MYAASAHPSSSRFFIALLPPVEIQEYANQVIRELGDRYKTRTAKAPPHITVQPPFLWHPETLPALEASLATFVQTQPTIPIALSGFGAFAPRVLYINVLKTPELLQLQANLTSHLEENLGVINTDAKRRSFSPHLTIASRNLSRQSFKQAWAELQDRPVEFEFISDRLTLLIHDGQRWQLQAEFPHATPIEKQ